MIEPEIQADFLTRTVVNGLTRLDIKTAAATASIYLQGSHLVAWQPATQAPVIFFSRKSELAPGKPFRGGIPIIFPWFSADTREDRGDALPGPSHGFARIQDWSLVGAKRKGNDVELVTTLGPTQMSRALGFDSFALTLTFTIGAALHVSLKVHNTGTQPLHFEDGFHTYFQVTDIHEVEITGLEQTPYIDKADHNLVKPGADLPVRFTKKTDRVYNNTAAPCSIADNAGGRRTTMVKAGSNSTVVFNPFDALADLAEWDWHNMVALEATNVGPNAIMLAPGATAELAMTVTVSPLKKPVT